MLSKKIFAACVAFSAIAMLVAVIGSGELYKATNEKGDGVCDLYKIFVGIIVEILTILGFALTLILLYKDKETDAISDRALAAFAVSLIFDGLAFLSLPSHLDFSSSGTGTQSGIDFIGLSTASGLALGALVAAVANKMPALPMPKAVLKKKNAASEES